MPKLEMSREWELDGELHRTADDARRQINKAKTGSLAAATDEYLEALRSDAAEWLVELQAEIALRAADREPPCDCARSGIGGTHEDHCATVVC